LVVTIIGLLGKHHLLVVPSLYHMMRVIMKYNSPDSWHGSLPHDSLACVNSILPYSKINLSPLSV